MKAPESRAGQQATTTALHPFQLNVVDTSGSRARTARLITEHGEIATPCFFPVGTAGTVKTLTPDELQNAGVQAILANSYHLFLRPGLEILEKAGGLHRFMRWPRPILTDSGGYQVFSLADLKRVRENGVEFQSHLDGSYHFFTPELVIRIQRAVGSDLMMVLDLCAPYPCSHSQAQQWNNHTVRWAAEAKTAAARQPELYGFRQALWGIVQGSVYQDLRHDSACRLIDLDFPGYAIGGLAVGEPKSAFREIVEQTATLLPLNKPRYLMGVGYPEDLLFAIGEGIDFFDCVLPTRNGRNGMAFTWQGRVHLRAAREKDSFRPIDETCGCYTCRRFDRAYLRHLFVAEEILGLRLVSLHNVHFYQELMRVAREHVASGDFVSWAARMGTMLPNSESTTMEVE